MRFLLLYSVLLTVASCRAPHPEAAPAQAVPCPVVPRTGDLVLRCGADATSDLFRKFSRRDPRYSHCGWIVMEEGRPFVYHCSGSERHPGEPLRRDPLSAFIHPAHALRYGIVRYRAAPERLVALERYIRKSYRLPVRYDLDFDLATDDYMYCTEFAAKSIRAAGIPYSVRPDTVSGRAYIAADALYGSPGAVLLCAVEN